MKNIKNISEFSRLSGLVELSVTFDDEDLLTCEPYDIAQKVSERFIQAAANLSDNDYLCFQLEADHDGNYQAFAFSVSERKVTVSDFDWIFRNFARTESVFENLNRESEDLSDKAYALICAENIKKDRGPSEHSTVCRTKDNIFEALAALKQNGSALHMIVNGKSQGIIVISLHEEMTLRMQTMLSLAFPDTQVKEIKDIDSISDGMNFLSSDSMMDFMSGVFTCMIEDRPVDISKLTSDYEFDDDPEYDESQAFTEDDTDSPDDSIPVCIEDLNLSVRAYNCLRRAGIHTVEDLLEMTDDELMNVRNLGKKSYEEVKKILSGLPVMPCSEVKSDVKYSELLDELIGLQNVKAQVRRITAYARMKQDMESDNKTSDPIVLNMQFVGNPGTAKTTVARIIAGIFYETGLLRSSEIVEVGRSDLVAGYVGQTAEKVRSVFKKAKGRLLFIDEAYSLIDLHRGSFGDEAISAIVQEMENSRSNTVVIFAGYSYEMNEFFSRNPGLRSRVPFTVRFSDYSVDEMVRITEYEIHKRGFSISSAAEGNIKTLCETAVKDPKAGNGRFCRNLAENAILNYAFRVYGEGEVSADNDYSLKPSDFEIEPSLLSTETDERIQIGFVS